MNKHIEVRSDQHWSGDRSPSYRSGLAYLLIGGGIGATIALLFAPKPGSQLRGDVAEATRKGLDAAKEKARALNEISSEFAHTVKEKTNAALSFATGRSGPDQAETEDSPFESVTKKSADTAGGNREQFGGTLSPG